MGKSIDVDNAFAHTGRTPSILCTQGVAPGCLLLPILGVFILDDNRNEATPILTIISMIANPYIQGKSFYRS